MIADIFPEMRYPAGAMANGWQEEKPPSEWDWIRSDIQNWFRGLKEWIFGLPHPEDEEENPRKQEEPARAITRWNSPAARKLRIFCWRRVRPWARWKRRHPFCGGLLVVSLILGGGVLLTQFFLALSLPASAPPVAASGQQSAASGDPGGEQSGLSLQLSQGWQERRSLPQAMALTQPPDVLWEEGNEAFARGDFAAAERKYRELLPMRRNSPMLRFRLMLCLLGRDLPSESRGIAAQLPPPEVANGPGGFYAAAVISLLDGEEARAERLIREAHLRFPMVASDYARVLEQFQNFHPLSARPSDWESTED
jgi:hypothetical protein